MFFFQPLAYNPKQHCCHNQTYRRYLSNRLCHNRQKASKYRHGKYDLSDQPVIIYRCHIFFFVGITFRDELTGNDLILYDTVGNNRPGICVTVINCGWQ